MNFENPTALRIGSSGWLGGRNYRVVGRVVMGVQDAGETYFWQEFNLRSDHSETATLVYEEMESGAEWKLFTEFEPSRPMSVQEAATKRVGDRVNLDGTEIRVTLVDESHIYHVEGEAPEGVEVGDVAKYFNAEGANKMIVVSWTGEEMEFFRGTNLARGTVRNAFGIRDEPKPIFRSPLQTTKSPTEWMVKAVVSLFAVIIIFAAYSSCRPATKLNYLSKPALVLSPLSIGSSGKIDGKNYRIKGHATVEVAQVGKVYDRHEYNLISDDGAPAILIFGFKPGANSWFLFVPETPAVSISPRQAAMAQVGNTIAIDGTASRVIELFQTTILQTEGEPSGQRVFRAVSYGFTSERNGLYWIANWNENGITIYRGKICAEKDIPGAFKKSS